MRVCDEVFDVYVCMHTWCIRICVIFLQTTQRQINADLKRQLDALQSTTKQSADACGNSDADVRPQFGGRRLKDPDSVYHQNAWDDVQMSEDDVANALDKIAIQVEIISGIKTTAIFSGTGVEWGG